jgi:hypothetical protein
MKLRNKLMSWEIQTKNKSQSVLGQLCRILPSKLVLAVCADVEEQRIHITLEWSKEEKAGTGGG